jgi:transcriptional regulator with XRE-family HTH domain
MQIGKRLRELRKKAGLSQEALARAAGLTGNTIARMERGVIRMGRPGTIEKLAAALGCKPTDLLSEQ